MTDATTPRDDMEPASIAPRASDEQVSFDGLVVAIDGPAASGKSTIAREVALASGLVHVDTGALYRAVALACLRAGVDVEDADACGSVAASVEVARPGERTLLDGEDVEDAIRGDEVTAAVSRIAAHPAVREALLEVQRRAVVDGGVIEGRDIGTVVLPDADLKVFLTASPEARAERRAGQLERQDVAVLAAAIAERDRLDRERAVSPLVAAEDAWTLDTTEWEVDEVVLAVLDRLREVALDRRASGPVDAITRRAALPLVVIVGRPNVGKSTLVNRILGERVAIVEARPGVTRDRVEHEAEWAGRPFVVVDTGGWEHAASGMGARIAEQAEAAIEGADLVLLVVDATVGVLDDDERYARLLRRSGVPVLLVANKVDGPSREGDLPELVALGLGEPVPVSARHGRGSGDLLDDVVARLPRTAEPHREAPLVPRVAIVGRPNVGKSSLFNRLLGEERSIVDAVPHTTRDPIDTLVELGGRTWRFVDTAGLRRRYRHGESTELFAVDRTRDAIEAADLVLFVIDASMPIGDQDQRLAALLRDAGRGVVLVCNKWDLIDEESRRVLEEGIERELGFASWAPRVNVSAASGRGVRRLAPMLERVWQDFTRRIPTAELNRIIERATSNHPPPRVGTRQARVRYATQPETAPPRFLLFTNAPLPDPYLRYLERSLREVYGFVGVPLAVEIKGRSERTDDRGRGGRPRRRS